jgi:TolA-binding protein
MAKASLYNLALSRRLMGSHAEAAADFERYRTSYPHDERAAEIAYQLGDIHDLTGDPARAAEAFEQALSVVEPGALRTEILYRLGTVREKLSDPEGALTAYAAAAESRDESDPFRLSAVARSAGLYEESEDYPRALAAYRDLMDHAEDPELVAAAAGRASELEAFINQ